MQRDWNAKKKERDCLREESNALTAIVEDSCEQVPELNDFREAVKEGKGVETRDKILAECALRRNALKAKQSEFKKTQMPALKRKFDQFNEDNEKIEANEKEERETEEQKLLVKEAPKPAKHKPPPRPTPVAQPAPQVVVSDNEDAMDDSEFRFNSQEDALPPPSKLAARVKSSAKLAKKTAVTRKKPAAKSNIPKVIVPFVKAKGERRGGRIGATQDGPAMTHNASRQFRRPAISAERNSDCEKSASSEARGLRVCAASVHPVWGAAHTFPASNTSPKVTFDLGPPMLGSVLHEHVIATSRANDVALAEEKKVEKKVEKKAEKKLEKKAPTPSMPKSKLASSASKSLIAKKKTHKQFKIEDTDEPNTLPDYRFDFGI